MSKGTLAALGAYLMWGLFPLYWRAIQSVPALEILSHRVVWSFLFLLALLTVRRSWGWLRPALRRPRVLLPFVATGLLLSVNWLTYIWAVNAGYIVDTSLGYFINPLVNVLLGVIFLHERLRLGQALAVFIALVGVLYLTLSYGVVLWIALSLALSFGFYGLLRKTAALSSQQGLMVEMVLLLVPASAYLLLQEGAGVAAFAHAGTRTTLLLALTGVVTALPLLLFAYGARRVTLITLGILQYVAPSGQFLLGVFVFGEALTPTRVIGFGIIWLALLVYSGEGTWQARRRAAAAPA